MWSEELKLNCCHDWTHLSEEVHLPQQVAEHGVDVIHL